eukprot:4219129-Pyramimonas_sp.AAC.1
MKRARGRSGGGAPARGTWRERAAELLQDIFNFIPAAVNDCRARRKWLPPARIPALRLLTRLIQPARRV